MTTFKQPEYAFGINLKQIVLPFDHLKSKLDTKSDFLFHSVIVSKLDQT